MYVQTLGRQVILYECCPSYMKLEGMKGCPAVAPIDHMHGTLGLVKATQTQQYADATKIGEELKGKGSFTIFAPSNDAWEQLDPLERSMLVSNVNVEMFNALHYHMVNRRLLTKDLKNDMMVTSMYKKLGLHINHYSNGIVTVNCARIVHGNQVSTNGVVHVVDRVISSISSTIMDVLESDNDLSTFNSVAFESGVMEMLDEPGQYTLFVPTNKAFEKLGSGYLKRIMGDKKVMSALVSYHLLNSVQCGEAILAGTVYETAEGSTIQIGCDGDSLTVNGIKMVLKKDIVATNGVVHIIDQVLVPDSAKEVMELVGETQSKFSDLVTELGLSAALGAETEYTLLAPVNSVFTDEVIRMDQSQLKEILESHILKLRVTLGELYNGQQLETLFGKLLRVFIYRTAVCIENACMLRGGKEGSNGALHLMQSLIKPARRSIYEILVTQGRFKIFLSLMESAGLTEMLEQEGAYTVFAPTDDAFDGLSKEDFELLIGDVNTLRTILLYHFSNGVFINGGLEGGVTNLLKTLQGQNLQVLSVNNSIHVNSVDVPDNDLMATNGVVHVVKNILYPANLPVGRKDLLILLRKIIKYITIKFVSGYSYAEIPLTFFRRTITTTKYVEIVPEVTKVTRVIAGDPKFNKVTRVISTGPISTKMLSGNEEEPVVTTVTDVMGEYSLNTHLRVDEVDPSITKVTRVIEVDPSLTTVTRVVGGDSSVTTVTRVIEVDPSLTTVTRVVGGDSSVTTVTRVVEVDPSFTKVTGVVEVDPSLTKVTRVVEVHPSLTKVTRVVGGNSSVTTVTRVVEVDPSVTKVTRVVGGGDSSITKVTRVGGRDSSHTEVTRIGGRDSSHTEVTRIGGRDPSITKVTRVVGGRDPSLTKVTRGGGRDPSLTKVTRVVGGRDPSLTKVTRGGGRDRSITKVTRVVDVDPSLTKVTRVVGGDTSMTTMIESESTVTRMVGQREPIITHVTRTIEGDPTSTQFTRVINREPTIIEIKRVGTNIGDLDMDGEMKKLLNEGPDFSQITTIIGDPSLIDAESERISQLIREGARPAALKRLPAGVRRRPMKSRRHLRPRQ
ncbi:hypothetical protein NHX12_009771 [Muraenolepis orangiensis]|uniref:FAS1 domain-containing protein n=1 Tax=Muraenolepis orangiensis TaxID=630683 RepID=A0A9Q0DLT2_9TELE|nr:hypothetical protein NHX12_009771 [Muraenolepis orangiensis]